MVEAEVERRIIALENANIVYEQEHKEIYKRLNEKDIADAIMREQLDTVVKTTNRIEEKIDEQAKLPANRWNSIVNSIWIAIASALVGAFMGLILK